MFSLSPATWHVILSLLTFLNIIESRAWLSIKTFETMNSVGVHSGKREVREHLGAGLAAGECAPRAFTMACAQGGCTWYG